MQAPRNGVESLAEAFDLNHRSSMSSTSGVNEIYWTGMSNPVNNQGMLDILLHSESATSISFGNINGHVPNDINSGWNVSESSSNEHIISLVRSNLGNMEQRNTFVMNHHSTELGRHNLANTEHGNTSIMNHHAETRIPGTQVNLNHTHSIVIPNTNFNRMEDVNTTTCSFQNASSNSNPSSVYHASAESNDSSATNKVVGLLTENDNSKLGCSLRQKSGKRKILRGDPSNRPFGEGSSNSLPVPITLDNLLQNNNIEDINRPNSGIIQEMSNSYPSSVVRENVGLTPRNLRRRLNSPHPQNSDNHLRPSTLLTFSSSNPIQSYQNLSQNSMFYPWIQASNPVIINSSSSHETLTPRSLPTNILVHPILRPGSEMGTRVQGSLNGNLQTGTHAMSQIPLSSSMTQQNHPLYQGTMSNLHSRSIISSSSTLSMGQNSSLLFPRDSVSLNQGSRQNAGAVNGQLSSRNLLTSRHGRSRMLTEIRNVLDRVRRGQSLSFEDGLLLRRSGFLGFLDFHDRHRDMRLDVDNMSYEELLALGERIGNVNTGLSEDVVSKHLKKKLYAPVSVENEDPNTCCVCREEYIEGEDIGTLDCGHYFHTDCIKKWLALKNLCPICKATALAT